MTTIFDRQLVIGDRGQFGDGHLESAVADQGKDRFIGASHLRSDGRGQAKTHRSQARRS